MKIVNLRTRDAGVTLRYACDGFALALGDAVISDVYVDGNHDYNK